ncbi:MAG TPA: NrsF family protein [Bryobacteraceae bacterium]|nr:NrsF family protein [Bryobacteraceae bacterium]
MRPEDVDRILAGSKEAPPPELLERISRRVTANATPVRPLASPWQYAAGLILIVIAVALLVAGILRMNALRVLNAVQMASIFAVIAIILVIVAAGCVVQMIPGSRQIARPVTRMVAASAALAALFAIEFQNYTTDAFVSHGIPCLRAGVITAIPAAILCWLILRRGFILNPVAAGTASGTLAGLAGLAMLEMHCPLLEAPHVMVWHVAVIPLSAGTGALAGRVAQLRGLKRRDAELMQ